MSEHPSTDTLRHQLRYWPPCVILLRSLDPNPDPGSMQATYVSEVWPAHLVVNGEPVGSLAARVKHLTEICGDNVRIVAIPEVYK